MADSDTEVKHDGLASLTLPTATLRRLARAVAVVTEEALIDVDDGQIVLGGRNGSNTSQIRVSVPAETGPGTGVGIDAVGLADALSTLDSDTEATLTLTADDYALSAGPYRYEAPTIGLTTGKNPIVINKVDDDELAQFECPAELLRAVIDYADTVGDSLSLVMDPEDDSLRAEVDGAIGDGTVHFDAEDVAVKDARDVESVYSIELLRELTNSMGGVSARCTVRFGEATPVMVSWEDGPVSYEWDLAPRVGPKS